MNNTPWFEKYLTRLLVDMHIPDWSPEMLKDFSADTYAEMMEKAHVDIAEVYAGSCLGLCYWPTKVGFQHKQLNGRDLLGEIIQACKKRNIPVQIYLNVWSRAAYEAHPEWRIVLENGKGTVDVGPSRFGLCCYNTGFRQYFLDLLDELNAGYETPGFWIDMIGNYCPCYCPACQERFRKETGYDAIPRKIDWNDPVWNAYEACHARWLNEFAEQIYAVVKRRTPERTVTLQSASLRLGRRSGIGKGFLQSTDYLAGDFVGDRIEQSYVCKLFSSFSKFRPMEFMTPRCENLTHHTTTRTYENLLMRSYAAIANQASFTQIDAIDPRGTLDSRFYDMAGKINDTYGKYRKFIRGSSIPCGDIGIFYNTDSMINPERCPRGPMDDETPADRAYDKRQIRIVDILQKNHLLFRFVHGCDAAAWKDLSLIILSSSYCLSDAECAALKEYVRNGGKVYASGETSLYDVSTGIQKDFRLADLFGVHYAGEKTEPLTYIAPTDENAIPGTVRDYPLTIEGRQVKITADPDTTVVGTLALPVSGIFEVWKFGSAISNPPMIFTDAPALVSHRYGKGEVVYCAGVPEEIDIDFHRKTMGALWKKLAGGTTVVTTNAPACVECTLFRQEAANRYIFSCLNLPVELPALPVYDLEFALKLPLNTAVRAVKLGADEKTCEFTMTDGVLHFRLDKLNEFALFAIETV